MIKEKPEEEIFMKENFIYWLKGNFITGITGAIIIFFSLPICEAFFCISYDYSWCKFIVKTDLYITTFLVLTAFLLIPFLMAMFMKIVKKDMPFYYYGTVGLFFLFILSSFDNNFSHLHLCGFSTFIKWFLYSFGIYIPVIISSLAGGCAVNIVRNHKRISLFYK
jgi:hypothetical protein